MTVHDSIRDDRILLQYYVHTIILVVLLKVINPTADKIIQTS